MCVEMKPDSLQPHDVFCIIANNCEFEPHSCLPYSAMCAHVVQILYRIP